MPNIKFDGFSIILGNDTGNWSFGPYTVLHYYFVALDKPYCPTQFHNELRHAWWNIYFELQFSSMANLELISLLKADWESNNFFQSYFHLACWIKMDIVYKQVYCWNSIMAKYTTYSYFFTILSCSIKRKLSFRISDQIKKYKFLQAICFCSVLIA